MTQVLTFNYADTSEDNIIVITPVTINPLNNVTPTSGIWYYYLLNFSEGTNIKITVPNNTIQILYSVVIGSGGSAGSNYYEESNGSYYGFGGGGGGGSVSLTSFNVTNGGIVNVSFGGFGVNIGDSSTDTSIQFGTNQSIFAGVGSNGGNVPQPVGNTQYEHIYHGGSGGNGANQPNSSGGSGGNGGTGYVYSMDSGYSYTGPIYELNGKSYLGIPGTSYNGATYKESYTYQGIGIEPSAYTPITMADGTKANVAVAGKQCESGNTTQVLVYYCLS